MNAQGVAPSLESAPLVLCIDDSVSGLVVRKALLETQGYRVSTASSAAEGISCFLALQPDVVVLDYEMPDGDGLWVARMLRHLDPTLPILMFSGSDAIPPNGRENLSGLLSKGTGPGALLVALDLMIEPGRPHCLTATPEA